ncbi:MAG: DCC1-like thiol-disulfide oxidoreductase family protein [Pseudomonadota bacterium]
MASDQTVNLSSTGRSAGLEAFPAYSYRDDPLVPDFPDNTQLIVFDGVCVMCSAFAQFVAKRDTEKRFRFAEAQSSLGGALFRHYGLDDVNFETNLLIQNGRAYGRMEAFVHIISQLGGAWPCVRALLVLPRPMRNWLYERIARNRYALFGRYESCPAQRDSNIAERLIG